MRVGGSGENLLHRQTGGAGTPHIGGLRARRNHDIVRVGYDDDAKLRPLQHLIDERSRIDGIPVSRVVLVATQLGEPASHREKGRCKHDASQIGASRQQRRGGVTALAVSSEMEARVSMAGFDRVERRGEKIDFARGPTFWRIRLRSRSYLAGPGTDTAFADCGTTLRFAPAFGPGSA